MNDIPEQSARSRGDITPRAIEQRFSSWRAGAAYPLRQDEILQAHCRLKDAPGNWGFLRLRITREAHRERAEYWFGPDRRFTTATDELMPEVMKAATDALWELAAAAEGYAPAIDANDSGRSIVFWNGEKITSVFIPSHPTDYQPPSQCVLAFDRLWSIIAGPP